MTTKTRSPITRFFRASIYAECIFSTADPKLTNSRYEVAREKMKAQGKLAAAIAGRHPMVTFVSEYTPVLWQATFTLEAEDEEILRRAVAEIESIDGLRLQGGTARRVAI